MKRVLALFLISVMIFNTCTAVLAKNSDTAPDDNQIFSDVPLNHWACESINDMYEWGVINGYADGTFKPDSFITRAELAKMLCSLGIDDPIYYDGLSDVDKESWYYEYASEAGEYFYIDYVSGKNGKNITTSNGNICEISGRQMTIVTPEFMKFAYNSMPGY